MFDQILFPTDGSDGAEFALEHVLDLAVRHDATVHILNVAETTQNGLLQIRGDDVDVLEQEGERAVREVAERAHGRGVDTVAEVVRGEPYCEIVDYAETHGLDLVVMPTHGRRGLERFRLGSTSERVVRRAR
ncbi:Nucleotide-binding universal stress protein, UspA family [Halogranum amylolyticum]|uniref:Nucleotide-binding universal stress protein, UspA family n=1 Tax=Halogranum amylolyticum TaxID=660520 RepID=A0A1H8THP4_9EURY|nr:universal stress protein [Halogranum amylolyticum]SEO90345.1 Nucleotide-binding universal stress protein, UspA family [Halogranum amylolyticum]